MPIDRQMVFHRRKFYDRTPGGHFTFEEQRTKVRMSGYGYGEHIVLRDEMGNTWKGSAERLDDNTVRYVFRDEKGRAASGVADRHGITLRGDDGRSWRGIVD